jgi:hypothetical protein
VRLRRPLARSASRYPRGLGLARRDGHGRPLARAGDWRPHAIFSLVNGLLLRALPVRAPERLVRLSTGPGEGKDQNSLITYDQIRHQVRPPLTPQAIHFIAGMATTATARTTPVVNRRMRRVRDSPTVASAALPLHVVVLDQRTTYGRWRVLRWRTRPAVVNCSTRSDTARISYSQKARWRRCAHGICPQDSPISFQ